MGLGRSMSLAETIYRTCIEMAEMEYLRAKARGIVSPVVELMALDPDCPIRVDVAVWEREELARVLDGKSSTAAAALRAGPPAGRELTILVATPDGVRIFDRGLPK